VTPVPLDYNDRKATRHPSGLDSAVTPGSGRVLGRGGSVVTVVHVNGGVSLGMSCCVVVTGVGEGGSWVGDGSCSMGVVVEGWSSGSMGVVVEGWSSGFPWGSFSVLVLGRGDPETAVALEPGRVFSRGRSVGMAISANSGVPLGTWVILRPTSLRSFEP